MIRINCTVPHTEKGLCVKVDNEPAPLVGVVGHKLRRSDGLRRRVVLLVPPPVDHLDRGLAVDLRVGVVGVHALVEQLEEGKVVGILVPASQVLRTEAHTYVLELRYVYTHSNKCMLLSILPFQARNS